MITMSLVMMLFLIVLFMILLLLSIIFKKKILLYMVFFMTVFAGNVYTLMNTVFYYNLDSVIVTKNENESLE